MNDFTEQWAPKVHPLSRPAEVEDPLELVAQPVSGDPRVMLEGILQEFIWMGWQEAELLRLFHDPAYPMLNELCQYYGPDEIQRQIASLLARSGVLRFHETIAEPDPEDEEPELVQITIPQSAIDPR
jgi:hypothetical protein